MLRPTPLRMAVSSIAGSIYGLLPNPAFAMSLTDVDWKSYLAWHSFTDWHSWLLVGSVAVLIVALMLRAVKPVNADGQPIQLEGDRYTRRIGTMPIYPPDALDAGTLA